MPFKKSDLSNLIIAKKIPSKSAKKKIIKNQWEWEGMRKRERETQRKGEIKRDNERQKDRKTERKEGRLRMKRKWFIGSGRERERET